MANLHHHARIITLELVLTTDDDDEAEQLAEAIVDWVYGSRPDLLTADGIMGSLTAVGDYQGVVVTVDEDTRMLSY